MSIDRGKDKEDVGCVCVCVCVCTTQPLKRNNQAIFSNTDGPRECHTDLSKSDREGEISFGISYMWNLKRNDKNELTKQKETHRLRKQTHGCWGAGIVKNFRKVMYTLLN